ncbi:MAG: helix-turn-helix domain-containing protein [Rhizobiaceae bacterium]
MKFGPKSKLTDHQKDKAFARLADGESCREIARYMGVSHTTISRLSK